MSILYGLYKPTEGEILVDGAPVEIDSPADGDRARHRHGPPALHARAGDDGGREHRARQASPHGRAAAGLRRPPGPRARAVGPLRAGRRSRRDVEDITVGTQQRVEILRALYRGAQILVLDEPTAVLTAQEVAELFGVLRALKRGRHLDRVHHAQAQRGARDRRPRHRAAARQADRHRPDRGRDRAQPGPAVVGRDVLLRLDKAAAEVRASRCCTSMTSHVRDDRGLQAVAAVAVGARRRDRRASPASTATASRSSSRRSRACAPPSRAASRRRPGHRRARRARRDRGRRRAHRRGPPPARARAAVHARREPGAARVPHARAVSARGWLRLRRMRDRARAAAARVRRARRRPRRAAARRCRAATSRRSASPARSPPTRRCSSPHQPTRGLDVGAIEFVHRRLVAERDEGRGILLVSLEYEEVRSLADRILVIYEGQIVGRVPARRHRGGARASR